MPFSIRLTKEIEARLERLSTLTKRPKSFFVNEALTQGRSIEKLEYIYLAEKAGEDVRAQREDQSGERVDIDPRRLALV